MDKDIKLSMILLILGISGFLYSIFSISIAIIERPTMWDAVVVGWSFLAILFSFLLVIPGLYYLIKNRVQ